MTFKIFFDASSMGREQLRGQIVFNDFERESFESPIEIWDRERYESQWKDGLRRCLAGRPSCLVTWAYDPAAPYFARMWTLHPDGATVKAQEVLVEFGAQHQAEAFLQDPYAELSSKIESDASTWVIPRDDLEDFLTQVTTEPG